MAAGRYKGPHETTAEATARLTHLNLADFMRAKIDSGWSKADLARLFGVSRHTISNWLTKRAITITVTRRTK